MAARRNAAYNAASVGPAHADEPEWSQSTQPTLSVRKTYGAEMNKVNVLVNVNREAAILAGRKQYGKTVVDIDPADLSEEQRKTLASLPVNENDCSNLTEVSYKSPRGANSYCHVTKKLPPIKDASPESIKALLDAYPQIFLACVAEEKPKVAEYKAKEELQQAEEAAKKPAIELWKADKLEALIAKYLNSDVHELIGKKLPSSLATCLIDNKWYRFELPISDERVKVRIDEVQALNDAAKVYADAAPMRKQAQIDAWVTAHATDGQRRRFARGLLPEAEILNGMCDTVFGWLNEFTRFVKITDAEVLKAENDDDDIYDSEADACEYESKEATKATDDECNKLEAIERAVLTEHPSAKTTLTNHNGGLSRNNHWSVTRKSILVETMVGEIKFARHYACP